MLIQFAGYDIEANSRVYNFDVVDSPREARQFTVRIESKTSRWGALKLQDGPGICFERLRRDLERETPELCVESHLRIEDRDVQEYLARQHPHKKYFDHRPEWANPFSPRHTQVFPAVGKPVSGLRA